MGKKHYIIPIFVPHEGCPHDCAFCNQARITGEETEEVIGPKFKMENNVDSDFVRNTVEEYLETIKKEEDTIIELSFFGGTFTAINKKKQQELLAVAKEYKDRGQIKYIRLSTRPDYINKNILDHLKSFSVDIIELGVQSLDGEVLIKSSRGHTIKHVEDASKLIKEYGFTLGHQVMLGLPGDNKEKDIKTAQKSVSMGPDMCRIYPALTIKDTPMEYMYKKGTYKPYELDECIDIAKEVYKIYHENNVNIIRVGLQATDNIAEGEDIVAGPFHPTFREHVESSLLNDSIYEFINDKNLSKDIIIEINERAISKLYANKKRYFKEIREKLNENRLSVKINNNLDKKIVLIKNEDEEYKINII